MDENRLTPASAPRRHTISEILLLVRKGVAIVNDYLPLWQQFRIEAEPFMRHFYAGHNTARETQIDKLKQLLNRSSATPIGQHYKFSSITSYDEYAAQVPVSNWAAVEHWVDQACADDESVLTSQQPLLFEPTSGSSAQRKLIPYTPALLSEFQSAIIVWLASLFDACPAIANGRGYWAMSPPTSTPATTDNGIPISSGNDIVYLQGSIVMPLLASVLNPPQSDPSTQNWRLVSLIAMINADDLAMMSSWSPTFLLTLLQPLIKQSNGDNPSEYEQVLNSVSSERKSAVIAAINEQNLNLLWPNLTIISCWADVKLGWRASKIKTFLVATCSNPSLRQAKGHRDLPTLLDAIDY